MVYRSELEHQPKAVSVIETGQLIGISPRGVWRLVQTGELRSFQIGRRRLVALREIDRFLEQQMRREEAA